jgi:hypothetical protein
MLNFLGNVALAAGRPAQARARFEEAMALNQTLDSPWGLAITHHNLAALHVALGNDGAALPALVQSLSMFQKAGVKHGVETCFETLAGVAQRQALLQRAAWCWGVVERLESDMGKRLELEQQARREAQLATLATLMGAEHLDQARQAGRSSPLDEAYRAVLAGSSQPAPAGASKAGL